MSTLQLSFKNNSGVNAANVYVGFVSGSLTASFKLTNLKNNQSIQPVDDGNGPYPAAGHWYTLDQLSAGVGVDDFSGRVYFCYDNPWQVVKREYEPAQSVTDPNFFLRYDKMEMTYRGDPYDVANLTSIDYWSIPLSLHTFKGNQAVENVAGLLPGVTAQQVFDALTQLTTPPVSGVSGPGGVDGTPLPALVPGQFQQYPSGPKPGKNFSRVIGPSSYPPINPPPSAIPVTPYDLFKNYLTYLLKQFGPGTGQGTTVPGLGDGIVAVIQGEFAGVGPSVPPSVPPSGPQSRQSYQLQATIDKDLNLTLAGTASGIQGNITMVYQADDLFNPSGIYGGNTPFYLNGSKTSTNPGNDVYGWIGGDLFSGLNIGALGSTVQVNGTAVGAMPSQSWFELPVADLFAELQPNQPNYNQWAATLAALSQAYNFAYTDRFAPVFVSLNPATADQLVVTLEAGSVRMS